MSLFDKIAAQVQGEVAVPKGRSNDAYFKSFVESRSNQKPVEVSTLPEISVPNVSIKVPAISPAPEIIELGPDAAAPIASGEAKNTTPSKRGAYRDDDTLYRIIGALAQALAEVAQTERVPLLKDGKAFPGGGLKRTGVAGYLLEQGLTGLKPTALQNHIGTALKNYERPQPRPTQIDPERNR